MNTTCFVDTKLLVRFRDFSEKDKQEKSAEWIKTFWESRSGRISYQVLNEYYIPLIVSSAQRAGCRYLLTEDMQHGQELNGLTIIDPFEVGPELLSSPVV